MDFTIIKRAGMSQLEFATLVGVNRVTANLWVRGKMSPHRFISQKIAQVIEAMQSAIDHQELPISADTPKLKRMQLIRGAVKAGALRLKDAART